MSLTRSEHVKKFKRTLFIRTKYNTRIFGVIPFIKLLILILFLFYFLFLLLLVVVVVVFVVFDIINSYWYDVL